MNNRIIESVMMLSVVAIIITASVISSEYVSAYVQSRTGQTESMPSQKENLLKFRMKSLRPSASDISVKVTVPQSLPLNGNASFTLLVSNTGKKDQKRVAVIHSLTHADASMNGEYVKLDTLLATKTCSETASKSGSSVRCSIANLKAGTNVRITLPYSVTQCGVGMTSIANVSVSGERRALTNSSVDRVGFSGCSLSD